MTILDAYAIIAALTDEPARSHVEPLLRSRTDPPKISAVNLAEVQDQLVRVKKRGVADVATALDLLSFGGLETISVDASLARTAGQLRAEHYHKDRCAVSLADCVAAATALAQGEPLATSDPHLARLVRTLDVRVVALPDTTGKPPS